ncbi:MAG: Omp28-related outer membrane protein [Bacteroidota bacterium]
MTYLINGTKKSFCVFGILFLTLFIGCGEEEVLIPPPPPPPVTGKVVLVEKLTGVECAHCPRGDERLASILKNNFPDNMVVVGIHGNLLTEPLEESLYDFRNQDARELEEFLKPFVGKPAAYINRRVFEGNEGFWGNSITGQWQTLIQNELETPQLIELRVAKTFDPVTATLKFNAGVQALEAMQGDYYITIMLLEDNIVDAQLNIDKIEDEYEHNHVLRETITHFRGDFFTDSFEENENKTIEYSYTFSETQQTDWEQQNMTIVAFIANREGSSEEIIQATSTRLMD